MQTPFLGFVVALTMATVPCAFAIEPVEGTQMQTTHVHLVWDAVPDADEYEVQLALDTGDGDPFDSPLLTPTTTSPDWIIKEGLEFGAQYVWHVRAIVGAEPLEWTEASHFSTRSIPPGFPLVVEVNEGEATPQPGMTLFNHCDSIVGYELDGSLSLLIDTPSNISSIEILPGGRLLCVGGGRATIMAMNGDTIWSSPDDNDLRVHHSASVTPTGGILMVVREYRDIEQDGVTRSWQGDRIVEMDPQTNEILFDWSTFDHYSTEDYDVHQNQYWNDWTHVNDAHFEPLDGRIWISCRHLSRVTSINYQTGEIVANIGMSMPSGDVAVGNDLFSYQHSPDLLSNGNLILFDNGNRRGGEDVGADGMSFAVELSLDGDPPSGAEIVWSWQTPIYAPSTGDANRLANGHTLVTSTQLGGVYEVTPAGDIAWHLDILANESCGGLRPGYRAIRLGSLYVDNDVPCTGDVDDNGEVGVDDLLVLIGQWGGPGSGDLDGSKVVGVDDLLLLLNAWGACP